VSDCVQAVADVSHHHDTSLSPMVADASCWSQQPLEYHLHQCAPDGISAHQRAPVRAPESVSEHTTERTRASCGATQVELPPD